MRFYNFEEVLLDTRVFVPADPEPRDMFGMPVVPDDSRALKPTCTLDAPCDPFRAALYRIAA